MGLFDVQLSEKDWYRQVSRQTGFKPSPTGYSNYLKHFRQLLSNPGLRHRQQYIPLEDLGGEEVDLFDAAEATEETSLISETGGTTYSGLGTTTAASAGVGSIGAASGNTLGSIAAGVGLTVGAASIGGAISGASAASEEKPRKSPPITLPDHKWLGPFNSNDPAIPEDLDDYFARVHDILYEEATSPEEVTKADRQFLLDTSSDFIENNNWHSLIAYLGIGGKAAIEKVIGVQYPFVSGKPWGSISGDGTLIIGLTNVLIGVV